MEPGSLHYVAAFTTTPEGGNPAGVWIGDALPSPADMQRIAREVGYSETIFIAPTRGIERTARYYSPEAEVSFCGHATIASGVILGEATGDGTYVLNTAVGAVPVRVDTIAGIREASLTSVAPMQRTADTSLLAAALAALDWRADELDERIPPVLAYAGAWHLVLAARTAQRLNALHYDFDVLKALMLDAGLTTLQLIRRVTEHEFDARNPFPVGGVVEDPATGAAAAALGGYLRDAKLVEAPVRFVINQGAGIGRPSRLVVDVPVEGGIVVRGNAVRIPTRLP